MSVGCRQAPSNMLYPVVSISEVNRFSALTPSCNGALEELAESWNKPKLKQLLRSAVMCSKKEGRKLLTAR